MTKYSWWPSQRVLAVLALLSLTLAGTWFWLRHEALDRHSNAQAIATTKPAVDRSASTQLNVSFDLIDHHNKATSRENFPGKFLLVTFGYTFCPDVCPATLQNMAEAMDQLAANEDGAAMAAQIQPLFITVDPGRDTVEVLADYVPHFGERLLGLTGSPEQITQATKSFRVFVGRPDAEEVKQGDYFLDHSAFIYLIAPNGRMLDYFGHETTADKLVERLRHNLSGQDAQSKSS